ncbi:MAG TPA: PEP-CTERM sorting domain-containing protein [Methylophilus sp.]
MFRWSALYWLLAALPIAAHANTTFSIASSHCSGEMSISSLNGTALTCSGNLMLEDGFVFSDTSIVMTATGDLWLDNLTLRAPNIVFSAAGNLTLGNHIHWSVIKAPNAGTIPATTPRPEISWSHFDIGTQSGGVISAGGTGNGNKPTPVNLPGGNIQLNNGALSVAGQASHPAVSASAVPEAETWTMLLAGLSLLAVRRKPYQLTA